MRASQTKQAGRLQGEFFIEIKAKKCGKKWLIKLKLDNFAV